MPLNPSEFPDQGGGVATAELSEFPDQAGNIDVAQQPDVVNPDGSVSTVRSFSTEIDGKEVLLPTIAPTGENWTKEQAIENYRKTGRNLGIFSSPESANEYAQSLHRSEAKRVSLNVASFPDQAVSEQPSPPNQSREAVRPTVSIGDLAHDLGLDVIAQMPSAFPLERPFPNQQPGIVNQAVAGALNLPADIWNFATTPAGAAIGGVAGLAPLLERAVAAGFTVDLIRQGLHAGNLQDRVEAFLGAGLGAYGTMRPTPLLPPERRTAAGLEPIAREPDVFDQVAPEPVAAAEQPQPAAEPVAAAPVLQTIDLPSEAQGAIQAAHRADMRGILNSQWVKETVPIESLRAGNEMLFQEGSTFIPRESKTKGPIVVSAGGIIIDGNNRVYESARRGENSVEIYREQKPQPSAAEPVAALPQTNTAPAAGDVIKVPPDQVALRPELMQYKAALDTTTGATQEHAETIVGKWDPYKAGNLLLWEPNNPQEYGLKQNERYIVANGHGRFNKVKAENVPEFNAQILRESAGYSADDARTLAAEANITDGKGTIYDTANFIRGQAAKLGPDEAMGRAKEIGARGRKGASIALNAADDLYASFINEQITPEAAASIADAAPGNEGLQRLGIAQALKGGAPADVYNFLQAVKSGIGDNTPAASQVDLFAADDVAIKAAEDAAKRAGAIQREIGDQINAVAGAAKRPEKARALGVDVADPASVNAKLDQLRQLRERARNWALDPQIRDLSMRGETPAGEAVTQLQTPVGTLLTRASRSDSMIRMSFDAKGRVPTPDEIRQQFADKGHDVRVSKFKTDLISATKGEVNYRVDVWNKDKLSSDAAKQAMADMFGADQPLRTETQFEQAYPLQERFGAAHEYGLRKMVGAESKAATPQQELLGQETPFNLAGEVETVKPPEETTAFGDQTLSQREMFGIQQITELKDPAKSADAAERIHGGPTQAAAAIQRQLNIMDRDPKVKRLFVKEQRQRSREVINLLNERAAQPMGGPGSPGVSEVLRAGSQLKQLSAVVGEALKGEPRASATRRVAKAVKAAETEGRRQRTEDGGQSRVKATWIALRDAYRNPPKQTDFKGALKDWQGADQRTSFEVRRWAQDLRRQIPDPLTREAITNYIEADGDENILRTRAAASRNKYQPGYEAALNLTDAQKTIAANVRQYFDGMLQDGINAGILEHGVENYITHLVKQPNKITRSLEAELQAGKLQKNFKYARGRIFDTNFDLEQKGYTPLTKDFSGLVAAYDMAFNKSLAARGFIKALRESKAADGEPVAKFSGYTQPVGPENAPPEAYLIKAGALPDKAVTADGRRYLPLDHPALRGWKYVVQQGAERPAYFQSDMLIHPDHWSHLKNVLSTSAFRQGKFGKMVMTPLFKLGALAKQTRLSLSLFHMDQEGLHGMFHRVNPANLVKINLDDPGQWSLIRNGLQVADYNAMELFSEGLRGGGLISKIPVLGELQNRYNEWLFKDYIPRLKMTMAMHALERNAKRYPNLSPDTLAELTGNQSNAAFGELNYKLMGRNPTVQDALRLAILAPDFLEARSKFIGQALKPYGKEQRAALILGAATLYVTGRVLNQWLDNDPHWDKPFSVIYNGREYRLRTVMGDVWEAFTDPRRFVMYRISPFLKTMETLRTGRDYRGIKLTAWEQIKDTLSWFVPIPVGQGNEASTVNQWIEQTPQRVLASAGVPNKPSETAVARVYKAALKFKEGLTDPKIQAEVRRAQQETYAPPDYLKLNRAILNVDKEEAVAEIVSLMKDQGKKSSDLLEYYSNLRLKPFTGSERLERQWRQAMTPPERAEYSKALQQRAEMTRFFYQIFPIARAQYLKEIGR